MRIQAPTSYTRLSAPVCTHGKRDLGDGFTEMQIAETMPTVMCEVDADPKIGWAAPEDRPDTGEFRLPDSKNGARALPLALSVVLLLSGLRCVEENPWVIADRISGCNLPTYSIPRRHMRERTGLKDVQNHDLRHSCSSLPLSLPA